jgi:integrase
VLELVRQLRQKGITDKTIANVLGALRVLFRDAQIAELVYTQPVLLPKKTLNRRRAKEPEIYQPAECQVLMVHAELDPRVRMFWTMALCTGMRLGEVAGRRWRDAQPADGLDALHVATQYGGAPLKTDNPRVVPIHPVLSAALLEWVGTWEALVGRKPGPDDFIVPNLDGSHLTRSQVYKALFRACSVTGIRWRTVHSTRHTMITLCRRGGADQSALERVTHNSRGGIVDGYTRQDWQPLCVAVECLRFEGDLRISLPSGKQGKNRFLPGHVEAPVAADMPKAIQGQPGSIPGASTSGSGNNSRATIANQPAIFSRHFVGSTGPSLAQLALASAAEAALARHALRMAVA